MLTNGFAINTTPISKDQIQWTFIIHNPNSFQTEIKNNVRKNVDNVSNHTSDLLKLLSFIINTPSIFNHQKKETTVII